MLEALVNAWRVPDLRQKIVFTFAMLVVFRFVAHVPVPGVDARSLQQLFDSNQLLGMLDRAVELTRTYVVERHQFGQPIAKFQGVQFQLTEADGWYYGRGTVDVKNEVAIISTNLIRLKREGVVPDRDIIAFFNTETMSTHRLVIEVHLEGPVFDISRP